MLSVCRIVEGTGGIWRSALSSNFIGRHSVTRYIPRNLASTAQDEKKSNTFTSLVYRFPHIRAVALVNRVKQLQSVIAVTGATVSFGLSVAGAITDTVTYYIVCAAVAGNLPFYLLGILCNNVIGGIYLSEDGETVKIAYLNFWGRRKDIVIKAEDIVPLSEISGNLSHPYFKIERYSQPCKLKLSLTHGKVEQTESFTKIFGSLKK